MLQNVRRELLVSVINGLPSIGIALPLLTLDLLIKNEIPFQSYPPGTQSSWLLNCDVKKYKLGHNFPLKYHKMKNKTYRNEARTLDT